MKILVIRFSSIGDIVLTTPVVRTLKTQLDNAEIHFAVKQKYQILLVDNPYIDVIHPLQGSLWDFIIKMKKEKFEYVVDLHHNLRTFIIKRMLRVTSFSFWKLNVEKWLMVKLKINKLPSIHIVDRYMETVKPLGVKKDTLGLDFYIPKKDEVSIHSLPTSYHLGYIVYAIGGQHDTKRLPVEKMIELCDIINRPIVLLGGEEDREDGERVQFFFKKDSSQKREKTLLDANKKTEVYNGCGKYNLNQSASLTKQADYVFAHDTGMMHIAAALKKEIFSIWGNTIPLFGMYPYDTKFTVLENTDLDCRPCSKIGFDQCPKGHFDCMKKMKFNFFLPEKS